MKTLNDAIGCWTVNRDYNSLPALATKVTEAARWCRDSTLHKRNDPHRLLRDLNILKARLGSMTETIDSAIKRCEEIIHTNELSG